MRGFEAACAVSCLLSLVLGCGREPVAAGDGAAAVTNVVTVTHEVVVTNAVTVTNVVFEGRGAARVLSGRRTAPYRVSAEKLDAVTLRKLLSDSGARVISCENGSVALVEASDRAVKSIRKVADVEVLSAEGKIAPDAGECVKVIPLSSIDAGPVAGAVLDLGGRVVQVVTVGRPAVRARLSYSAIRKLAERGDVRCIERDGE